MEFSNTYIVDFQFLCGNATNEYFITELAICQLETLNISTYNFKPPYSKQHLTNDKSKKTNDFMDKFFNVNWNFGNISYLRLNEKLLELNGKKVYVKGETKKMILQQYVGADTKIENLEYLYSDIPSLKNLQKIDSKCKSHLEFSNCICAYKNVLNLVMFLFEKMLLNNIM